MILFRERFYFEHEGNDVEIDVELRLDSQNRTVFSASGRIYGADGSYCGGQCLDSIAELGIVDEKLDRILDVWGKYHLHDIHAGTIAQEEALEELYEEKGYVVEYGEEVVEFLKEKGLYEDDGYVYGTKWLYRPLPEEVIEEIKGWEQWI